MEYFIEVNVLGLDTDKNVIYAEQNAGSSGEYDKPLWITLVNNTTGDCSDGVRATHEDWLEQTNKLQTSVDGTYSVVLAGSAIYYLLNHDKITIDLTETA